jgi:hypothetical protein
MPVQEELSPTPGDILDCVVVAWHVNAHGHSSGFARRISPTFTKGTRDGLHICSDDFITQGEETVRVGSHIRGTVAEPVEIYNSFHLVNIEIFI